MYLSTIQLKITATGNLLLKKDILFFSEYILCVYYRLQLSSCPVKQPER